MFGSNTATHNLTLNAVAVPKLPASRHRFKLETPLLALSSRDPWTLGDACEGTQIMGGTGSGKTSGSGRAIAHAFLRAGYGGLVLCAKPSEAALWRRYAQETGRERSLIVFGEDGSRRFNFLDYEIRRGNRLVTQNLVSLFMRIMDGAKGNEDNKGEPFWRDAVSLLLGNAFLALYSAWGRITLGELMRFIETAPRTKEQTSNESWMQSSLHVTTLRKMIEQPEYSLAPQDQQVVVGYFRDSWPNAGDRMRSSIEFTLSGLCRPLLTGYMREMFCSTTNTIPEMTHEGAVIVVDLPIKEHDDSGILAQHIWKYLWQRAAERRKDTASDTTRPVFLWADECQFFVSKYDMEFQSTARSSKACTVYMTQNMPTYFERMKGNNPEHAAHALLGNFQTKIFHQNLDPTTNQYAADLIGRMWQTVHSTGTSSGTNNGWNQGSSYNSGSSFTTSQGGQMSGGSSTGRGWTEGSSGGHNSGRSDNYSQQVEYELLPSAFAGLRKGGRGQKPEAIMIQGGRVFRHSGRPWIKCEFPQK